VPALLTLGCATASAQHEDTRARNNMTELNWKGAVNHTVVLSSHRFISFFPGPQNTLIQIANLPAFQRHRNKIQCAIASDNVALKFALRKK
jgi:hypothetical protein